MTKEKDIQEVVPNVPEREPEWKRWKVRPELAPLPGDPPESGIGARIAFCRAGLDNLSVEALARYTRHFDKAGDGVSRSSLIRYESGQTLPGARELRILSETLNASVHWLVFGYQVPGEDDVWTDLRKALRRFLISEGALDVPKFVIDLSERAEQEEVERRQRLIHEARQPSPR